MVTNCCHVILAVKKSLLKELPLVSTFPGSLKFGNDFQASLKKKKEEEEEEEANGKNKKTKNTIL